MKNAASLVLIIVGVIVGQYVVRTAMSPSIDSSLVQACNEINKNTPMMVDHVTRLDNAAPLPGEIKYLYTLMTDESITPEQEKAIEEAVRNQVKHSSDLEVFRERGIDMSYVYRDQEGREIFGFTIEH